MFVVDGARASNRNVQEVPAIPVVIDTSQIQRYLFVLAVTMPTERVNETNTIADVCTHEGEGGQIRAP